MLPSDTLQTLWEKYVILYIHVFQVCQIYGHLNSNKSVAGKQNVLIRKKKVWLCGWVKKGTYESGCDKRLIKLFLARLHMYMCPSQYFI